MAEKKSTTRSSRSAAGKSAARASSSRSASSARSAGSTERTAASKPTAKKSSAAKPKAPAKKAAAAKSKAPARTSKRGITKAEAEREAQKRARNVDKYRDNPEETEKLLNKAKQKAKKNTGQLAGKLDDLTTLMRMVSAYVKGDYRDVPWKSIAAAIGAIVYFVSPADVIPDVIPGFGYIDDVAVIGYVVVALDSDLADFREWEAEQELG